MRFWWLGLCAVVAAGCGGLKDMVTAHTDAVARVGGRDLAAQRLAEVFVQSRSLPMRSDIMERVAHLWVDYSLFAQRVASGDSLLDSATVVATEWPQVRQLLVGRLHQQVIASHRDLDSAGVDSAYTAGDYRLIRHILIRTQPNMTPEQVSAKRRQAEHIRAGLKAGGSWARANEQNEDLNAKAQDGIIGVVGRGETVTPFDSAAFALNAGELSSVIQTQYGFHVVARPSLGSVRQAFRSGVQQRLVAHDDSIYLSDLMAKKHVALHSGAVAALREAVRDPIAARQSHTVLATYDGGRFTAGDVARWLDVLPPQTTQTIESATDEDLEGFIKVLVRNELLPAEARAEHIALTDDEYRQLHDDVADQITRLKTALGLDALSAADAGSASDRQAAAAEKVNAYLDRIAADIQALVPVPPGLADRLREGSAWKVYPAGVQRAFDLARAQRATLDSAAGRTAPDAGAPPRP